MATILIVDDRPINREVLAVPLQYKGYQILQAADGAEALEIVQKESPDLVITDILMPKMDGYEFVRRLRNNPAIARTKVILYSATYSAAEVSPLLKSAAVTFLRKPSEISAILQAVEKELSIAPPIPTSLEGPEFEEEHLRAVSNKLAKKVQELEIANNSLERELIERQNIERALQETQARLGLAMDIAKLGSWDWDLTSEKLQLSERENAIFGFKPGESLSHLNDLLNRIHPDDRLRVEQTLQFSIANGTDYHCEYQVIWPDRSVHWIAARGRAIQDSSGTVTRLIGTCIDVTQQKQTEKQLEKALQTRDDVIAIVSHDLKNPIGVVDLNADLLLKQAAIQQVPRLIEKTARAIHQATARMTKLINNLLDISKLESGTFKIDPKEETMGSMIQEILNIMRPLAEAKRLRIKENVNCTQQRVICDRDKVAQVLSNILGNAIKFTPEGGSIAIQCDQIGRAVLIAISDTGPGIRPEDLPHIFDRFWQAKRTQQAGSGLGLAIAKGIVEAHGGGICVDSRLNSGTTIYFTLPMGLPTEMKRSA